MSDEKNTAAQKPAAPVATPAAPAAAEPTKEKRRPTDSETSFDAATGVCIVTTTDGVEASKGGKSVTIRYELGKTVAEAVAKLGEDVVLRKLAAELMRNISNNGRAELKKDGATPASVAEKFKTWKPGLKVERGPKVDPQLAFAQRLASMSPEEQQKEIQALLAKAGSLNKA